MWIKLHVDPGEDLDSAIKQAVAMARHLSVNVEFKFNGTRCIVKPDDDPGYVVRRYHEDAVNRRKRKDVPPVHEHCCQHPGCYERSAHI